MKEIVEILKSNVVEIDKHIESLIPKSFDGWIEDAFGISKWEYDIEAIDGVIAKPIWALLERGGKRWRPFLMNLVYLAVGGKGNIEKFLPIPEVIHNGTLMVDDIEDNSDNRRGKPCIHKIFGDDIAINAGNAMYYLPMISVLKDEYLDIETKVKIYEFVNEEMIKISFGQGMDIYWHRGNNVPTEKQYLQMCAYKTGALARMAAKLGAILGGASDEQVEALGNFAESLGIAFQIQDDILNITNSEWGKDFGDDISEGKRTLIVIKTLEKCSESDFKDLVGILDIGTKNKVLINEAVRILKENGGVEYSREISKRLVIDAWKNVDSVLKDSDSKNKLKFLLDFVVDRNV